MAGLVSIADIVRMAQTIHRLCQDAQAKRAALKEAELKVAVVMEILSELPPEAASQTALQQVYVGLTALYETVTKMNRMKLFLYAYKAKECVNEIRHQTANLQFYMNSLQVSQTAAVFRKLVKMDDALDAVEDESSLRKQIELERKQQKDLNALLRNQHALDAAELERRGWIQSNEEIQELVQQLMEERDRLVANHERDKSAIKDRMEAQHLEQMIQLLERPALVPAEISSPQLPLQVIESVTCPITSEIMDDPVIVDGIHCKCCMSRQAFETWQKTKNSNNTCPNCRGPLRSNRVSPNVGLAQVAAFVMSQQQTEIAPSTSFHSTYTSSNPSLHAPATTLDQPSPPTQSHPSIHESSVEVVTSMFSEQELVSSPPPAAADVSILHPPCQDLETLVSRGFQYVFQTQLKGHTSKVSACAALGTSKVVSVSHDFTIRVWDTDTGECLRHFGHGLTPGPIKCCGAFGDGCTIVTSSAQSLQVRNSETGECLRKLFGHNRDVCCVTVLQNDEGILSGSSDKTLRVWSVATGECVHVLKGHTAAVRCCAALQSGRKLLSGSDDKTLKVWDLDSGDCVQTLRGHLSSVSCPM